ITHLFDPLVQRGLRGSALLLLLAQLGQAILQLLDLQLERLAAAGDAGFGRHRLAGSLLNASGRFRADTGDALLGRPQALLHQADLSQAPPAQAGQGKAQRTDQCPQRPGAGAFGRHLAAGDPAAAYSRLLARLCEILAALRGQAGQVVELVVGVVTHGRTYGWNEETEMPRSIPIRHYAISVAPSRCAMHRRRAQQGHRLVRSPAVPQKLNWYALCFCPDASASIVRRSQASRRPESSAEHLARHAWYSRWEAAG